MSLVRRVARPLLATIFVYGGMDAFRHPASKAPAADKVLTRLPPGLPVVGTTEQVVRFDGAAKVIGGTLLALGRFPRLAALSLIASLVPTTVAGHRPWEETDPATRKMQTLQVAKNASIIGGLLLAVVDTDGKPSMGWRARRAARRVARNAADARAAVAAHLPD